MGSRLSTTENEVAVIAACLDGDAFADVSQIVNREDFAEKSLATAFSWMQELYSARRPVDLWTLRQVYGGNSTFAEVVEVIRGAPEVSAGNAVHLAHILSDKAALRRALLSLQAATRAAEMSDSYRDAKTGIEAALSSVMNERSRSEIIHIRDVVSQVRQNITAGRAQVERFPTGFPTLDRMCKGGPGAGHLMIVAGPTSAGKTTLGGNILTNMAAAGTPCGIFSLEMTADELTLRFGLSLADEYQNSNAALAKVESLPVWISDNPDRTAESVRGAIRLMVLRYGIRVAMVDYLQLLAETDPKQPRERQVAHMSRHLKLAAKESGVCVLALSQLNDDGRLRESRALENDADGIVYVVPFKGCHYLWLSKNRHGEKHGPASEITEHVTKRGIQVDFHASNFRFTEAR